MGRASQASRRDAHPTREDWPRVGARFEDGVVVVRVLLDGEKPALKRAVLRAEPCEQFRTVPEAIRQAAKRLAESLRKAADPTVSVVIHPAIPQ